MKEMLTREGAHQVLFGDELFETDGTYVHWVMVLEQGGGTDRVEGKRAGRGETEQTWVDVERTYGAERFRRGGCWATAEERAEQEGWGEMEGGHCGCGLGLA